MTNLEAALKYLDRGLSVIPLHSPKLLKTSLPEEEPERKNYIDKCKQPIVPWTKYQHRLPTKEEIKKWFTENPHANIGIVTGRVSGLVVFDLDSDEAKKFADEQGGFPKTPMVVSGRGHHVYMRYPGFDVRNNTNSKLKIDIRADGGQVVAPPSVHATGREYQWVEGHSILDLEPAECLPWMIDYLKSIATSKAGPKPEKTSKPKDVTKPAEHIKAGYAEILATGCSEGERNDTAARLIGHFMKKGMNEAEVWEIIRNWNQKNDPPMSEGELLKIFESIKTIELQNQKPKHEISSFLYKEPDIIFNYAERHVCLPFGHNNLTNLEQKMAGGLVGGNLYILGGIPTAAKTTLVNNISDNLCLKDQPVLFFSYDDGKTELLNRTFARFSDYSIEDFNTRSLSNSTITTIIQKPDIARIRNYKYVVEKNIYIEEWKSLIDQIAEKHGKAPVIVIDYLKKLRTRKKQNDERLRVDFIITNLTDLAKQYNIPVMAISELARDAYKTGLRLSMASFKESGTIEYEASWLGILAAVEEKNGEYCVKNNWEKIIQQDGKIDLIIFKAKRGTGATGRIPLKLNRQKMLVTDRESFSASAKVVKMKTRKSRFE